MTKCTLNSLVSASYVVRGVVIVQHFLITCSLKICKKICTHKNFHYTVVGYVCIAVSVKKVKLGGRGPELLLVATSTYILCAIVCYTMEC